jgi:putative tryptophan/tyrosine transport system substrate-binding protein
MRRREFIAWIGSAVAWPLGARGQQRGMPVIGFLNTASPEPFAKLVRAFHDGLGVSGYIEGQNVAIEYRWALGQNDRLQELAADLARSQVNVIAATGGSPAVFAARAATTSIPIVFQVGVDPVKLGLVASLSRPGGNITGATMLAVQLGPKRVELLHELLPGRTRFAALVNPTSPDTETAIHDISEAAKALKLELQVLQASSELDFDPVFRRLSGLSADGLLIAGDPLFNAYSERLAHLTLHYDIPAIYQFRQFSAAGGLLSYGGDIADAYWQAGNYTGRILKGESPSDLPVQQSKKVELIINLKTARALGLTVPLSLLGRADEVIE